MKKILVIRLSSIGDIVLSTPIYRILKKKFPNSQIDILTKSEFAEILQYNPNIDNVLCFQKNDSVFNWRKKIIFNSYDVILDLHNSLRSKILRLFSAKKNYVICKNIFKRTLLIKLRLNFFKKNIPIPLKYIAVGKSIGIEDDKLGLEIFIPDEIKTSANEKLNNFLNQKKIIVISPTAKHKTKIFPKEKFIEFAKKISQLCDVNIVIIGSNTDFLYCKELVEKINFDKEIAYNFAGKLSLLETSVLIEKCNVVVTNDSASLHIASAMKKKCVAIFGSTVREFGFFPFRTEFEIIENKNLKCRPCSHIGKNKCPKKHFKCMNDIKVDEVVEKVLKFLR